MKLNISYFHQKFRSFRFYFKLIQLAYKIQKVQEKQQ